MTLSATMPFPARLKTELRIDPVMMLVSVALLFGGLVILASASITVSDNTVGEPFFYVERQLLAAAIGGAAAKGHTRPGPPAHEPVGQDGQRHPPVEAPIASRARAWDHCAIRFMIGQ